MIKIPPQVRMASAAVASAALTRQAAPGGVVLAYHDVVREEPGENEWVVSAQRLRSHVMTLRRFGFEIVPLGDMIDRFEAGESLDGLAALTFDDALLGVYRLGAPTLADLGAPATVFVVSDAPEGPPAWWPNSGPIMSNDQVHELAREGWTIGAHSATHASLPSCDADQLAKEVQGCRDRLGDRGFPETDLFAYPFGHYDPTVVSALDEAGFRAAFSFLNGRVETNLDRLRLPRLTMGIHSTSARLAYHLLRRPQDWPDHQLQSSRTVSGG